ncbi:MAG: serine hydrolase domain-containing protein [Gemmatimonadaceae bacterium]
MTMILLRHAPRAVIALAAMMAPPPYPARAQSPARDSVADSAAIEAYVRPYVESNNFSGQILVARRGHVVFHRAYGEADREHKVANTLQTRMHIASLSMQFTAAAIMRLVDLRKLTLDTHVATIVPTVRASQTITVRNLLEERSGISDINQRNDYTEILRHHQTPASLVAVISGDTLLFPPGSQYLHEEHSAYNLLALIIEKKTGLPFSVALKRLVFDPLRMTRSGADDDAVPESAYIARGYDPVGVFGLTQSTPIHWSAKSGNASVYLTASEEAKWINALFKGSFLSPTARAAIVDSAGPPVGYGWFRRPSKRFGELAYYMNGRAPGFASFVVYLPHADLTVVALSNIYSSVTTDIGNDIAAIVLGKPYTPLTLGTPPTQAELLGLDGLAFTFGSDFYQPKATLAFSSKGEELFLRWPTGDLSPMIPLKRDRFVDRSYWEPVAVERDSSGHVVAITYDRFRGGLARR